MTNMSRIICVILVTVGTFDYISSDEIPSYIKLCHRKDPQLNACIIKSVEELLPILAVGIPELDIPGLEPLHSGDIVISQHSGNTHFSLNLTDIELHGCSNFIINKLKTEVPQTPSDALIAKLSIAFPHIYLKGRFSVNTRILALPIQSTGTFSANATDVHGNAVLRGKLVRESDGFDHLKFFDVIINLKINDYHLQLNNVSSDAVLNEALNDIANANKAEILKLSEPFITATIQETVRTIANKITSHLKYDEVFPE